MFQLSQIDGHFVTKVDDEEDPMMAGMGMGTKQKKKSKKSNKKQSKAASIEVCLPEMLHLIVGSGLSCPSVTDLGSCIDSFPCSSHASHAWCTSQSTSARGHTSSHARGACEVRYDVHNIAVSMLAGATLSWSVV